MGTPGENHETKAHTPNRRHNGSVAEENQELSWLRDREELTEGVAGLISWRREEGFPPETDDEMIAGVINIVESIRIRNIRIYERAIRDAVARGEGSPEQVGMAILRSWLRKTAREIEKVESEQQGRRSGESSM